MKDEKDRYVKDDKKDRKADGECGENRTLNNKAGLDTEEKDNAEPKFNSESKHSGEENSDGKESVFKNSTPTDVGEGVDVYADMANVRDPREVSFSRSFVAVMLILLLITAVSVVCLVIRGANYRPPVDTGIPFGTGENTGQSGSTPGTGGLDDDVAESGVDSAENSGLTDNFVRNEKKYNFLVVGVDRVAGLSDTIMVVNFNTESGEISVVQLPRDTYVEVDGRGCKLNSTYVSLGITGMRDLLEKNLCINIDYYAVVYLEALTYAVDAVGGVTVEIPFDMKYSDPEQGLYIDLKAGLQTLDGDKAQQFVRYRSGYAMGDLGRVNAQKKFMAALLTKMRQSVSLSMAEDIIGKILPMVDTDLTAEDCIYFATRVLRGGGAEGLTMLTAPGRAITPLSIGGSYYVFSRSAMLDAVNGYLNVYSTQISNDMFDPERIFVRDNDDDFERVYTYTPVSADTVRGEDVTPEAPIEPPQT